VSKDINSEALVLLRKSLGMAGTAGPDTLLDEDFVAQSLDIARFARQGLAPGSGLFYFVMTVVTSVGNPNLTILIPDIYEPRSGALDLSLPPYPSTVPTGFDIYLIGCSLSLSNTTLANAAFSVTSDQFSMGVGVNNNDTTVEVLTQAGRTIPMASWDTVVSVAGSELATLGASGKVWTKLGTRLQRGSGLFFNFAAGGANQGNLVILASLQPTALGQDVGV